MKHMNVVISNDIPGELSQIMSVAVVRYLCQ